MVNCCAVKGCKNTQSQKKYSFFRIPKNPHYREAWLAVCSKKVKALMNARICSAHFRPECFKPMSASVEFIHKLLNTVPRRIKKLHPDAVPTENLPPKVRKSNVNSNSASVRENLGNNEYAGESSSETTNNNAKNVSTDEKLPGISDNTNNVSVDERSPEISNNTNNVPTDVGLSERNNDILNNIFSSLPECNFTSEEEKKCYLDRLQQIKQEINEKMKELQKANEKEKRERERKEKEIEKLRKDRREQCDALLLKFLQLKKSETYWKRECFLNQIKLYYAEHKCN